MVASPLCTFFGVSALPIVAASAESAGDVPSSFFALAVGRLATEGPRGLRASGGRGSDSQRCRAVAMRFMPTQPLTDYFRCLEGDVQPNSDHDWSVPGAEIASQIGCWCRHNITSTIEEYGCCNHADVYPMCSMDCTPDCESTLATECVQTCPAMCFETAEYVVDAALCRNCDWVTCWPVVQCLTKHAEVRVDVGNLSRTCHETDFEHSEELKDYWECWRNAPKHSSHWNILSSLMHCMCREEMPRIAKSTACCDSVYFGAGVCDMQCMTEKECATQEAQTCIQVCQYKCPASELAASTDCQSHCLSSDGPCRRYLSCRPPSVSSHVCDDGRWPDAASGCCYSGNMTALVGNGCPKLCETQKVWRLDRRPAHPWWSTWHDGRDSMLQCTCQDCPRTEIEGFEKLQRTIEDSIWDNGQVMLVDIARREGLRLGPTARMQRLMIERNAKIKAIMEEHTGLSEQNGRGALDDAIAAMNARYVQMITDAARLGPDDDMPPPGESGTKVEKDTYHPTWVVILAFTVALLFGISVTTCCVLKRRAKETPVTSFHGSEPSVVVGNPVPMGRDVDGDVKSGAPVMVAAATKGKNTKIDGRSFVS